MHTMCAAAKTSWEVVSGSDLAGALVGAAQMWKSYAPIASLEQKVGGTCFCQLVRASYNEFPALPTVHSVDTNKEQPLGAIEPSLERHRRLVVSPA
jgi:hypothetical protein